MSRAIPLFGIRDPAEGETGDQGWNDVERTAMTRKQRRPARRREAKAARRRARKARP